jgi:hypothetical protein
MELDDIHIAYTEILAASSIINIDPNRRGDGISYFGSPVWGWKKSDDALEAERTGHSGSRPATSSTMPRSSRPPRRATGSTSTTSPHTAGPR